MFGLFFFFLNFTVHEEGLQSLGARINSGT